jgi:hypothetical protein
MSHGLQGVGIYDPCPSGGKRDPNGHGRRVPRVKAGISDVAGLGGSIDLVNRGSHPFFPSSEHFSWKHVPTTVTVLKRAQVIGFLTVILENHAVQGRDSQHPPHPVSLNGHEYGIDLRHGHEYRGVSQIETQAPGTAPKP